LLAGAALGVILRLVYIGHPTDAFDVMSWSFVVFAPIVVSTVAVYLAERAAPRTCWYYIAVGALANSLFVLGTMLIMLEGLICGILAMPMFATIGGVAGLLAGLVFRWIRWPRSTLYGVAAAPVVLGWFAQFTPLPDSVQMVERSVVIAAPPERVWPHLLQATQIQSNELGDALMYRIGVPLPLSAATEQQGNALVRHIRMGKNVHFDQVADEWQPGKHVRWTYRFAQDSFPAGALDDHVRIGGDYFDIIDTEYTLTPTANGTRLTAQMRYRVSTHFNWYAKPVAEILVRNFEEAALAFYAHRATASATPI
jgi:uncharacterized protein YndB with AHSA1/START domain